MTLPPDYASLFDLALKNANDHAPTGTALRCPQCVEIFTKARFTQTFCSTDCGKAFRARKSNMPRTLPPIACAWCHDQFVPATANALFCQNACKRSMDALSKRVGEQIIKLVPALVGAVGGDGLARKAAQGKAFGGIIRIARRAGQDIPATQKRLAKRREAQRARRAAKVRRADNGPLSAG